MVKILSRSIREYKKESIQAPILVALEVVMEVVIPLLMANLIDYGIETGYGIYMEDGTGAFSGSFFIPLFWSRGWKGSSIRFSRICEKPKKRYVL